MILVKSIEVIEVESNDFHTIQYCNPDTMIRVNKGRDMLPASVLLELVRGQRFVRGDGTEIVIGMAQPVQDILGLQFEAWENLQNDWSIADNSRVIAGRLAKGYQLELEELSSAGFFERLKMLFTGYRRS